MTERKPGWKRALRGILIALMILTTAINALAFAVVGVPKLKSHAVQRRTTKYILAHCDEMTECALRLHDEVEANTIVDYRDWEVYWFPKAGSDAFVVQFVCRSWGIAPSSVYEGVYYSSDGKACDFSLLGAGVDHDESDYIDFGWYWYKMVT